MRVSDAKAICLVFRFHRLLNNNYLSKNGMTRNFLQKWANNIDKFVDISFLELLQKIFK